MRLFCCFLLLVVSVNASPDIVNQAHALYQRTEYQASLRILASDPAPDAASYLLMGKNHFMMGDYKKAIESLEKARGLDPTSSEIELWIGRAWGRRAEGGSPFAIMYASRTRQ